MSNEITCTKLRENNTVKLVIKAIINLKHVIDWEHDRKVETYSESIGF